MKMEASNFMANPPPASPAFRRGGRMKMEKICVIPALHEAWPESLEKKIVVRDIISEHESDEVTASRQGGWAYEFGYGRSFNPYPMANVNHEDWNTGWNLSRSDSDA